MNKTLLTLAAFSFCALAQAFTINMNCGEVIKARNGKILKRLEPSIFGLNSKYVLMTKFNNPIGYTVNGSSEDNYDLILGEVEQKSFTAFSLKDKFRTQKKMIKEAIKKAKADGSDLYACVGQIRVPLKYSGSHVYLSHDSIDEAMKKMIKQGARHAW